MKTKFGTLVLLGGLSLTAAAQSPTAVADIYSRTDYVKAGSQTVVANAFSCHQGGFSPELSALQTLMASIDPRYVDTLVEGVNADVDGVSIGWNAAERQLTVGCLADKLGRLEVRVFNLEGVQLAFEPLAETTTTISLTDVAPGYCLVALTEEGKLIKTIKLHLK